MPKELADNPKVQELIGRIQDLRILNNELEMKNNKLTIDNDNLNSNISKLYNDHNKLWDDYHGVVDENECLKSDCVKLQQYLMSKENLTELPDINIAGDFYDDSDSIVDCKYY